MNADPYRPETNAPDPDEKSTALVRALAWLRVHVTAQGVILTSIFAIMWCVMAESAIEARWIAWIVIAIGPAAEGLVWLIEGTDAKHQRRAAPVCANAAAMAIALTVLT